MIGWRLEREFSCADAGTGAGGGSGGGNENHGAEEVPTGGKIGAVGMGCNCNSVDAGILPLFALGLALLRRRRS